MKNIKHIIGWGAIALLTAFASVSCTDGNDWDEDSAYDRLFSVVSSTLSVSPEAIKATVKWTGTPNTEYYIIEVSTDTLYNEVAMNSGNSIVFGEDKSIVESPYELVGLDDNTKYFIRIKAMSSSKAESNWAYLENKSFKTKTEQIITKYTYDETTAKLEWEAGLEVTHLVIVTDGVGRRLDLSAENIAQGTIEISGFEQNTQYTIYIYNNEKIRGSAEFKTLEFVSGPGTRYDLDGTEDLQTYIDALTENEVILVLPNDAKYDTSADVLTIPDHITAITFWGAAGDEKTYMKIKEIRLGNQPTFYLRIHNMEVEGGLTTDYYILNDNPSGARTITNLTIDNCYIHALRGVVRFRAALTINNISIDNCIIDNIGSYGLLAVDANTLVVGDVKVENSTVSNFTGNSQVFTFKSPAASLTINQSTFYNVQPADKYLINFDNAANIPPSFNINNSIMSGTGLTVRATNPKITSNFADNTYHTNDYVVATNYPFTGISSYSGSSTDLFADPENRDFTIKDGAFNSNIGDPRWK